MFPSELRPIRELIVYGPNFAVNRELSRSAHRIERSLEQPPKQAHELGWGMADCIYCCARKDSDDHVPPKGLIRIARRINLWTVPSCHRCNGGASRDEEYFRLMIIGALCHTPEADELFEGAISRSMDKCPAKESWLFDSLYVDAQERPFLEWDHNRITRVAVKIATGLAHVTRQAPPPQQWRLALREAAGRGDHTQWAPDFSFSHCAGTWELWFFDSVRITIGPA
jgi:hypothetical protein